MRLELSWILPVEVAASLLLARFAPHHRRRIRFVWGVIGVSALLAALSFGLPSPWIPETAWAFGQVAAIHLAVLFLFGIVLRRLRFPQLAGDLVIGAGYVFVAGSTLSHAGVNLTGLIATSAVATAMIGFALQDLLGNLAGGVALQLERSLHEGDWLKTEQGVGQIKAMHLRYTALETPDGDTILIPNSALTKAPLTIIGRGIYSESDSVNHRKLIRFFLPYRFQPPDVVEAVESAIEAAPLEGVASQPRARCVVVDYASGHVDYGLLVWLTRPGMEFADSSSVRLRLFYALSRMGAPLDTISHVLEMHQPAAHADAAERFSAVERTELFGVLRPEERERLSRRMRPARFAPGERILQQGEAGDSLYLIARGSVSVAVAAASGASEVLATLAAGEFFGEMSLLAGEPRTATVTAASLTECWVLSKADIADLLETRPALAAELSAVLEERRKGLTDAQQRLAGVRVSAQQDADLLTRVRRWFGLRSIAEKPRL